MIRLKAMDQFPMNCITGFAEKSQTLALKIKSQVQAEIHQNGS